MFFLPVAIVLFLVSPALAADGADAAEVVLLERAPYSVSKSEFEADMARVPPEHRSAYLQSVRRIEQQLNGLLVIKTLAADARRAGADKPEAVRRLVDLEVDRVLARAELQRLEDVAAKDFDNRLPEFTAHARERYVIDQTKYSMPEQVSASHILFSTSKRTPEEALELARAAKARIKGGADFRALAQQISEDPSAKTNHGALGWFGAESMDPAFARAAFSLTGVGTVSDPVLSKYGYHIIRLDGRRAARKLSFDEVKDDILKDLKKRHVESARESRLTEIREDPAIVINRKEVDLLRFRVDPETYKAARSLGLPSGPTTIPPSH